MSSDFETSKKILEKIKAQKIRPLPLWIFKVRRLFLVLIFILSTAFGALSISILWVNLSLFSLYSQIRIGRGFGVFFIPAIWFALSFVFFIIAYFHFRKSPRGYRASSFKLIAGLAVLSITLGSGLFFSGYSQTIHHYIRHKIPVYGGLHQQMNDLSCSPPEGMLCGHIENDVATFFSSKISILTDEMGQKWLVDINGAEVRGLPRIEIEKRVRIWGSVTDQHVFKALDVRPYPLE